MENNVQQKGETRKENRKPQYLMTTATTKTTTTTTKTMTQMTMTTT